MNLTEIRQQFTANESEYSAILAKGDGASVEELDRAQELLSANEELKAQIEAAPKASDLQARAASLTSFATASAGNVSHTASPAGNTTRVVSADEVRTFSVPAKARVTKVANFKDRDGSSAAARAYAFGNWLLGSSFNRQRSRQWCQDNGLEFVALDADGRRVELGHNEIVNSQGGFLVPAPLETDLIDLRERFGVARQICRNRVMTSETLSIPRRTSGLTAYYATDEDAATESTKGWDRVNLVAKKLLCLAKISSELNEDAIINVADDLAGEIAYAFASAEDDAFINGDGTDTYGTINGVRNRLTSVDGAGTDSAGLFTGTGNAYSELTLADFNNVKSKLPEYADDDSVVWVVHKTFWAAVMERLALAAGGITEAMIAAGAQRRFLGYDVVISQKMPSSEANSQVCALLGNFRLGASFGDRRMTTILVSEHAYFANDQIGVRGSERYDINVHDVGSSSTPGPIVGLVTAGS